MALIALLSDHRELLDEIARKLLADEVIDQAEIAAIMARPQRLRVCRRARSRAGETRPAPAGNGSPAGLANAAEEEPEQAEGGSATPPPGRA